MSDQKDLHKLYELKEKGIISEKEYQALSVGPKHFTIEEPLIDNTKDLSLFGYFLHCVTEKYRTILGRARRKEFFGFWLGYLALQIMLFVILCCISPLFFLFILVKRILDLILILPAICVTIRRMHDVGFSAWWFFIPILPCILVFFPSNKQANKFGQVPRGVRRKKTSF